MELNYIIWDNLKNVYVNLKMVFVSHRVIKRAKTLIFFINLSLYILFYLICLK